MNTNSNTMELIKKWVIKQILPLINLLLTIFLICEVFGFSDFRNLFANKTGVNFVGIEFTTPIQRLTMENKKLKEDIFNLNTLTKDNKQSITNLIHNIKNYVSIDEYKNNIKNYVSINDYKNDMDNISNWFVYLKGNTNLSEQIKYWQYKYDNYPYSGTSCDNREFFSTPECQELRNRITNLQQKLNQ